MIGRDLPAESLVTFDSAAVTETLADLDNQHAAARAATMRLVGRIKYNSERVYAYDSIAGTLYLREGRL